MTGRHKEERSSNKIYGIPGYLYPVNVANNREGIVQQL
jgi:hypothetical protein